MEFFTTDGKLLIQGSTITQRRFTNTRRRNIFLYCFFLLFFINVFIERLEIAQVADKTTKWVSVCIYGLVLLFYSLIMLDFLFRQYLKSKVDISKIDKIKLYRSEEGLETNIVLTMKSKRYKHYKFRTLERQFETLVETIRSLNPTIQLVTE